MLRQAELLIVGEAATFMDEAALPIAKLREKGQTEFIIHGK